MPQSKFKEIYAPIQIHRDCQDVAFGEEWVTKVHKRV